LNALDFKRLYIYNVHIIFFLVRTALLTDELTGPALFELPAKPL